MGRDDAPGDALPGPLTITYLGDARDEKGYHLLPAAVSHLWSRGVRADKARFVAQSNFNIPGGEPLAARARPLLQQFAPSHVRLLLEPLDTAGYRQMLAEADIVLLPYDADCYEARSSGILVEALTAGKIVVTTAGSWMATQVDPDHSLVFATPEDFPNAVEQAVREFPRRSLQGQAVARRWTRRSDPKTFMRALVARRDSVGQDGRRRNHCTHPVGRVAEAMPEGAPEGVSEGVPGITPDGSRVLLVMDGDAVLLRNGAGQVVANRIDFLIRAGYRVTALFISTQPDITPPLAFRFQQRLEEHFADIPLIDLFTAIHAPSSDDEASHAVFQSERRAGRYSIARDLAFSRGLRMPARLGRHLAACPPRVVLLNYVTFLPVLDNLCLGDTPVICEMHDFQSHQKAIYAGRDVDPFDVRRELELLAQCRHVIAVNAQEAERLRSDLPGLAVTCVPIRVNIRPVQPADLAGYTSMLDIVRGCGCRWTDLGDPSFSSRLTERLTRFEQIDLLFISSSHTANASGLRWFLDQVYRPFLAGLGITLLVAGTIGALDGWPTTEGVAFTGAVENVRPLYAAARIVILPILEGAGSPVKTIEAMAHGKPVVATPFALRGLRGAVDALEPCVTATAFAHRISRLLADAGARRDAGAQALEAAANTTTQAEYDKALTKVFEHVMDAPPSPNIASSPAAELPFRFVEWDASVALLNKVLAVLAASAEVDSDNGRIVEGDSFRAVLEAISAPCMKLLLVDRLGGLKRQGAPHGLDDPDTVRMLIAIAARSDAWRDGQGATVATP